MFSARSVNGCRLLTKSVNVIDDNVIVIDDNVIDDNAVDNAVDDDDIFVDDIGFNSISVLILQSSSRRLVLLSILNYN